jgi:Arc/MetJ-type ribon-helix-helix transcriptional regulator
MNQKITTVLLTEQQHEKLRQICFDKRVSHSSIIRDALNQYLGVKDETKINDS